MNLWHLVMDMPTRRKVPSAIPAEQTDPLSEAADRLSAEVRCLREVLDEVREDFSWVTRNGLPIQPMEHVRVRRMARDPNADDWAARLVVDRFALPENVQASPLESDSLDALARNLTAAFEAAAKGQLGPVLQAVDGVQARLVAVLKQQGGNEISEPASVATTPARPTATAPTDIPVEDSPARPAKRKRGELF